MKTLTAQLRAPWQVRLVEVDLPDTPPPNHVLLKINACGICGSDLTAAQKNPDFQPFGHEIAATIEKIALDVTNVSPGQSVALESSSYCGTCDLCRAGRVDLCTKASHFWKQPAMGFSQFMIAPACACVPYTGLSADVASLTEPVGVAFDMVKTANIQLADRVAVVGLGPIGLAAVALAKHGGASQVTAITHAHSRRRAEVAQELGAKIETVDGPLSDRTDLAAQFEHVLVTAPVDILPEAFSLLTYGGIITYVGIGTGDPFIRFDANHFHFRKLQLRASFAAPAIYYPQVLRLLRAGVVPGEKLISHRFKLADMQTALHTCRDDKANAVKVIMTA